MNIMKKILFTTILSLLLITIGCGSEPQILPEERINYIREVRIITETRKEISIESIEIGNLIRVGGIIQNYAHYNREILHGKASGVDTVDIHLSLGSGWSAICFFNPKKNLNYFNLEPGGFVIIQGIVNKKSLDQSLLILEDCEFSNFIDIIE